MVYCYEITELFYKKNFSTDVGRAEKVTTKLNGTGIQVPRENEVSDILPNGD